MLNAGVLRWKEVGCRGTSDKTEKKKYKKGGKRRVGMGGLTVSNQEGSKKLQQRRMGKGLQRSWRNIGKKRNGGQCHLWWIS